MGTLSLVRVDYRLAHGQVRASWFNYINPKSVIIMCDETANDPFLIQVMAATMPTTKLKAYSIADGVERWKKDEFGNGRVIVIFKEIGDAYNAYNMGFEFPHLNIGQVPMDEGRRLAVATVCLNDKELDMLKDLASKGVNVYTHQTVENKKYSLDEIIASMGGKE